jgi:hypothetical protein
VSPELAEIADCFDEFATVDERWRRRNPTYHRLVESLTCFHVPRGTSVLEIGSGHGDLLAALEPSRGRDRRQPTDGRGGRRTPPRTRV